ncbi:MAG: hypothetical protein R3B72_04220 [Polyangiaceae bacterium]
MKGIGWAVVATTVAGLVAGSACGDDSGSGGQGGAASGGGMSSGGGPATGGGAAEGGAGGSAPAIPADVEAAIRSLYGAWCEAYFRCMAFGPYLFGTETQCVDRLTAWQAALWRPGTDSGLTAASANACAAALTTYATSCDGAYLTFYDGTSDPNFPMDCFSPGTRPAGESCETNFQCASARCARPNGESCGTCMDRAALGESCSFEADECALGALCAPDGVCKKPGELSEPCDENAPCLRGLYQCASDNTCQPRFGVGESCNAMGDTGCANDNPVCGFGLMCEALGTGAMLGEPCWVQPDEGIIFCDDLACQVDNMNMGTCVERLGPGDPCTPRDDIVFEPDLCPDPYRCIAGTCQLEGDTFHCP